MFGLKSSVVIILLLFLLPVQGCTNAENKQGESVFKKVPELVEIKPDRPVKIKLKRSTKGKYSWELAGDDADKILREERKLRESLQKN